MEFALIAPVLVVLFFAVYDISDAMITYEEVFNAARTIAASASNVSVTSTQTTKLYYGQVELQASAIFAQMPSLRSGFHTGIKSITISAVNFEATSTNCTPGVSCNYNAYVVWSAAYPGPGGTTGLSLTPALRSCATETNNVLDAASALMQTGPAAGTPSNLAQIRTSAITTPDPYPAAPDPIIVVDVHYQYTPVFNMFVHNPLDFWANGYWPLRSVQATQLQANGTFTAVAADQQYTGLVSTGTPAGNAVGPPYSITAADVYPAGDTLAGTASAPPSANYCISDYYAEPQS
jgi:Flp pilus assembly protein TadG